MRFLEARFICSVLVSDVLANPYQTLVMRPLFSLIRGGRLLDLIPEYKHVV